VIGIRLAVPVLAFIVLACGGIPKTAPTQIVDLMENSSGDFVLLVYDESGLVVNAVGVDAGPEASTAQAIAHPEMNEITVSWMGGACAYGPQLAIKGDAAALTLELDRAPLEFSLVTKDCPAIGLFFAVTLTLSEPVAQNAASLVLLSR
jgi:hypothetical protein